MLYFRPFRYQFYWLVYNLDVRELEQNIVVNIAKRFTYSKLDETQHGLPSLNRTNAHTIPL